MFGGCSVAGSCPRTVLNMGRQQISPIYSAHPGIDNFEDNSTYQIYICIYVNISCNIIGGGLFT